MRALLVFLLLGLLAASALELPEHVGNLEGPAEATRHGRVSGRGAKQRAGCDASQRPCGEFWCFSTQKYVWVVVKPLQELSAAKKSPPPSLKRRPPPPPPKRRPPPPTKPPPSLLAIVAQRNDMNMLESFIQV